MSRRSDIDRIAAFASRFARVQAAEVVDLRWGFALLQPTFAMSHEHNRLVVTSGASAADILATAEAVLGAARIRHRYVSVEDDELGHALNIDFLAAGYERESIATMIYSGPDVDRTPVPVQAVSLATLRPAIIRDSRVMLPNATDDEISQLADRTALYDRGAEVTRLAVVEGDEIVARADLFIDRQDRIAQLENVVTHEDFRGRGYGGALVREALWRGRDAGCELSCLTASLDDWPVDWYRRLGYVDIGRSHHFSRPD